MQFSSKQKQRYYTISDTGNIDFGAFWKKHSSPVPFLLCKQHVKETWEEEMRHGDKQNIKNWDSKEKTKKNLDGEENVVDRQLYGLSEEYR